MRARQPVALMPKTVTAMWVFACRAARAADREPAIGMSVSTPKALRGLSHADPRRTTTGRPASCSRFGLLIRSSGFETHGAHRRAVKVRLIRADGAEARGNSAVIDAGYRLDA